MNEQNMMNKEEEKQDWKISEKKKSKSGPNRQFPDHNMLRIDSFPHIISEEGD